MRDTISLPGKIENQLTFSEKASGVCRAGFSAENNQGHLSQVSKGKALKNENIACKRQSLCLPDGDSGSNMRKTERGINVRNGKSSQRQGRRKQSLSNLAATAFLVAVVVALMLSLTSKSDSGAPRVIAGWSASTILTSSMSDVYPQGALVITRYTDPVELEVGDDIMYMSSATSTITHRIVSIETDPDNMSEFAFITKGTMNKEVDKDPVPASNVVGKIVYSSELLGAVFELIRSWWLLFVFLFALVLVMKVVLARILGKHIKGKGETERRKKAETCVKTQEQYRGAGPVKREKEAQRNAYSQQKPDLQIGCKGGIGAAPYG